MMLKEVMSEKELAELFRKKTFRTRFPAASDRAAWEAGDSAFRRKRFAMLLKHADCQKAGEYVQAYPPLKAEDYFAFIRNGNRTVYESFYFARRSSLSLFSMAEAIEYKKRFLPDVIEGIWQLMNELVWYLPAHGNYREGDPMPRFDQPRTDLFCAETGAILAFAVQLLGKEIGEESKELLMWVKELCIQRVIAPVEDDTVPQWWLGGLNNWSPWCASNVAMTAFTFLQDQPERLARLIFKLIDVCEKFYGRYAPDGGCDEGPGYFMVAGIRFMLFMDLLNAYTDNAYAKLYSEEKFRNIGDYIVKVHLTGPWFASMADAEAKFEQMNPGLLNRFAELSGSPLLKSLAVDAVYRFAPHSVTELPEFSNDIGRQRAIRFLLQEELAQIFWCPKELARSKSQAKRLTVLPDLQFFLFRQDLENDRNGTVFCIKGGHNGESHNHNDVGQFEVFYDGSPVIVDCGSTDYTRFTFSEHRYENRFLNSSGHNVPAFNGMLQPPGEEFSAKILNCADEVAIDIAGAYPKESGIVSCVRRAALASDGTALIEDSVSGTGKNSVELPLFCAVKPEETPAGIRIGKMKLALSGISVERIEEVPVTDKRMKNSWGDTLWCIHLKTEFDGSGSWKMEFVPAE